MYRSHQFKNALQRTARLRFLSQHQPDLVSASILRSAEKRAETLAAQILEPAVPSAHSVVTVGMLARR
jgi:hypothetical protein